MPRISMPAVRIGKKAPRLTRVVLASAQTSIDNWKKSNFRELCAKFADGKIFQTIATVFTLYALFGDDFRLMATAEDADPTFNGLTISAIAIFTIEICASSIGKKGYCGGFFFWLDIIATATLPLDITWVYEYVFIGSDTGDGDTSSLRASRASRAGSRAGRVVRLIRLIRLIRIIKLYKMHLDKLKKTEQIKLGELRGPVEEDEPEAEDVTHESRVGKKLTEMTTRRVIIIVLVMLFVSPFWRVDGMLINGSLIQKGTPFALDQVADTFFRYVEMLESNPNSPDIEYLQQLYQHKLLLLVYYHSPYAAADTPPASSPTTLFWFGYTLPIGVESREVDFMNLTQSNRTQPGKDWDMLFDQGSTGFDATRLPDEIKKRFSSIWTRECVEPSLPNVRAIGVSLQLDNACPNTLRHQERQFYDSSVQRHDARFVLYMDQRSSVQIEAVFNVSLTLFVVAVLASGSWMFSRDANKLVLFPVERMMARMIKIRQNPFEAMKMNEEEYHRELQNAAAQVRVFGISIPPRLHFLVPASYKREKTEKEMLLMPKKELMETVILEKTIIKLGGLCALGFGEAGSAIIASNMQAGQSADITVMVPGRRVDAIFGFCDIRNFTDATEVLQDAVMVFVNQISEIVHTIVDEHRGAANKNIGDAFLLVWRLETDSRRWLHQRTADLSILCFLRIVAWTNRSPVLAAYRTHEGLLARMPNYRVRIGYGLHLGWAIEGAIGSEFKVDASYLSMNVNMASSLEAATKTYAVLMLFTDTLVEAASPDMRNLCRKIDRVILRGGTQEPFNIYTVDLDYQALSVYPTLDQRNLRAGVMNRCVFTGAKLTRKYKFEFRAERQAKKRSYVLPSFEPHRVALEDEDIAIMRARYAECPQFQHKFAMAFYNYVAGEWPVAKDMLLELQNVLPPPKRAMDLPVSEVEIPTGRKPVRLTRMMSSLSCLGIATAAGDGPSNALLTFMKQYDFDAPKGWQGYRDLD